MGHLRYLAFYLICGVLAGLTQVLITLNLDPSAQDALIPNLGASGAIAAVLAAYLVLYPHARVNALIFIGFFFTFTRLSALLLIGFWFVLQFIPGGQLARPAGRQRRRGGLGACGWLRGRACAGQDVPAAARGARARGAPALVWRDNPAGRAAPVGRVSVQSLARFLRLLVAADLSGRLSSSGRRRGSSRPFYPGLQWRCGADRQDGVDRHLRGRSRRGTLHRSAGDQRQRTHDWPAAGCGGRVLTIVLPRGTD